MKSKTIWLVSYKGQPEHAFAEMVDAEKWVSDKGYGGRTILPVDYA